MRPTIALVSLALLAVACSATAADEHVEGTIADVRAEIVQVRLRFSAKLTRLIVDDKTDLQKHESTTPESLAPGTRLFGMGDREGDGRVKPRFMEVVEGGPGPLPPNVRGIEGTGYGRSVMLNGTVRSAQPFVFADATGKEIVLRRDAPFPVLRWVKAGREALLVGQAIRADGEQTPDGLLKARSVRVELAPGSSGALIAEVATIQGRTVTVKPRFGDETITLTMSEDATVRRQATIDPDTVKVGDTLTAQGRLTEGTSAGPAAMVASVLMPGQQSYPRPKQDGFWATLEGAARTEITCTGKVTSLSPFILTLEDGRSVTVTIPGQTPVVDLRPAALSDVKPGDRVLVVGSDTKDGTLVGSALVLGASPIIGFGG